MAQITFPILIKVLSVDDALRSFRDLAALLADAPDDVVECVRSKPARLILSRLVAGDDAGDLLLGEPIGRAAAGAGELKGFEFHPSDGYIELFAAVAAHRKQYVFFRHGWPLLSVDADTPSTLTEAGGVRNLTGGGLAA